MSLDGGGFRDKGNSEREEIKATEREGMRKALHRAIQAALLGGALVGAPLEGAEAAKRVQHPRHESIGSPAPVPEKPTQRNFNLNPGTVTKVESYASPEAQLAAEAREVQKNIKVARLAFEDADAVARAFVVTNEQKYAEIRLIINSMVVRLNEIEMRLTESIRISKYDSPVDRPASNATTPTGAIQEQLLEAANALKQADTALRKANSTANEMHNAAVVATFSNVDKLLAEIERSNSNLIEMNVKRR